MARSLLLYDRDCGFCRCAAAALLAWVGGRRLRAVALQDPEADRLLEGMDADRRMASWHLVLPDGSVSSGGAAVAPLLERLPAGRPLATLARALPGPTDRTYRWVAEHRGTLARLLLGRRCHPERG